MLFRSVALCTFALLFAMPAQAASSSPVLLGKYGSWLAFQAKEKGDPVCYMKLTNRVAYSTKDSKKRRKSVLILTHRPAEGALDVVSYDAGADLKPSTDVKAEAANEKFEMFTYKTTAWGRDAATDRALAIALRRGWQFEVMGRLDNGAAFRDTLSLKGSSSAYETITKACGLPLPAIKK